MHIMRMSFGTEPQLSKKPASIWPLLLGLEVSEAPEPFDSPKYRVHDTSWRLSRKLRWTGQHQRQVEWWRASQENEARHYSLALAEVFQTAKQVYPSVSMDVEVMAGAPCIQGTRIPVYMILDAIEYHGSLEGALESYPGLTIEQVKQAIGFAKLVVECPLGDEA